MDDENGLFNIEIDSSSESAPEIEKVPRDFQSEEDFQIVKNTYQPKVETGEVSTRYFHREWFRYIADG